MKVYPLDQSKFPFLLRAIYVRDSHMRMADGFDPLLAGQELRGLFRTESRPVLMSKVVDTAAGELRLCTFVTRFGFRYDRPPTDNSELGDGPSDELILAEITADIAVSYSVSGQDMPTEATLTNWSQTSALLHTWPYWREFSHSAMVRMSLPLSIMPMMDFQAVMAGSSPSADQEGDGTAKATAKRPSKRARSAAK